MKPQTEETLANIIATPIAYTLCLLALPVVVIGRCYYKLKGDLK